MYRCTPTSSKIYCHACDLSDESAIDDIKQLVQTGEVVILVDDEDLISDMFPDDEVEIV